MEVFMKENRLELAVCGSKPSSFQDLLVSQQELVYSQIDQLENIVLTQCNLTGVNPLSQEMAAGALSIKIGKRPRDLLNPKAVRYMQSVFSIKDAITKKESREISALFGVTVTQVRDFFTSQRSRVRRFVRLSRDKALRSTTSKEVHDGDPMNIDPTIPIYPVPLKVQDGVPMNTDPTIPIYPIPLNSVGPASNEEGPSCSTQEEALPGLDDSDRHFTENIFSLMRKEETFSGQVKLMEWILQIQNASVLLWFLTKGGVMILATWLSQAANEEQTSVLHAILKVLSHLPLHKALPVHMSAILQSVNSLRFYWTSDISNRARFLLARWSKIFARSQAMKKPNAVKSSADAQNEMLLKQSISEIMGDESWESKIDGPDGSLVPSFEGSENFRKFEPLQPLKLLPAPVDDSSKKLIRGVSSSQTRERRKVLMVEQPGQKSAGRSLPVARSVTATQGRPLSADDIQKAKLRAQFMQSKYGKSGASSGEGHQVKTEGLTKVSFSPARTLLSVSKAHVQPQVEEHKDSVVLPPQGSIQQEAPIGKTMNLDPFEPLWKKCKRVQIAWQTPAEARIHEAWSVSTGENSKEVEVQRNRIRREKETIYRTSQEVPSNPKEPWDREMEYDDTLTPEIPTEQLPDGDGGETLVSPRENKTNNNAVSLGLQSTTTQNGNGSSMPEPDLELLAVLLKNPELVFALTSGQGVGSLSSEETVRLLDMIKANGVAASLSSLSGGGLGGRNAEESVQVSLPSPTPSSDPVTMQSGWRPPEVSKNPFSRGSSESSVPNPINFMAQQQAMPRYSLAQTATVLPEKLPLPPRVAPQFHQTAATISPPPNTQQMPPVLRMENVHDEAASFYVTPAPISITINAPGRQQPPLAYPSAPTTLPPEPQHSTHSWVANQNHYNNAFVGGGGGGPLPRDRNEYVGGRSRFESWSPDRSPMRSTEYNMSGWNYPEPGTDMGGGHNNYRSELDDPYHHHHHHDRSRPPRNSSSGYRDSDNRHGNRRWRDDRRR